MEVHPQHPNIASGDHHAYMQYALSLARQSPPRPSNFRVGAVLVDATATAATAGRDTILATGYTLELPGNTHAEQCCLMKLAEKHGIQEEQLASLDEAALPAALALYTTMEPCSFRLSGNLPCVQRVLRLAGLGEQQQKQQQQQPPSHKKRKVTVYVGVTEPDKFVSQNTGRQTLETAGIEVIHVTGLEDDILEVATAGHKKEAETEAHVGTGTEAESSK